MRQPLVRLKIAAECKTFSIKFILSILNQSNTHIQNNLTMIADGILIGKRPLRTSPHDRINAYNHHALAPWLAETGFLTPLYFHRRAKEIRPFNMARWITPPAIKEHLLRPPTVVLEFSPSQLQLMLTAAAVSDYGSKEKLHLVSKDLTRIANDLGDLGEVPESGFFVRVSNCSLKDADDGNQKPLFSIYDALVKIISSKRAVHSFLDLQNEPDTVDHKIFFLPYFDGLDKLSEWRCFIFKGNVVAMSQTRFYRNHHKDVKDGALRELVRQARQLWVEIAPAFEFESTILDLYADVRELGFQVKLIELNPWGPHLGTGSLLFHWIDDKDILEPEIYSGKTILRLVRPRGRNEVPEKYLAKATVNEIGHANIIPDELRVLKQRGLQWTLHPKETQKLMSLPVPGKEGHEITVSRKEALKVFKREFDVGAESGTKIRKKPDPKTESGGEKLGTGQGRGMALHARFKRMQKAFVEDEESNGRVIEGELKEFVELTSEEVDRESVN
jgi:hypothetical protein